MNSEQEQHTTEFFNEQNPFSIWKKQLRAMAIFLTLLKKTCSNKHKLRRGEENYKKEKWEEIKIHYIIAPLLQLLCCCKISKQNSTFIYIYLDVTLKTKYTLCLFSSLWFIFYPCAKEKHDNLGQTYSLDSLYFCHEKKREKNDMKMT